jgi:serine/threonine-protein kinase
MGDGPTGSATAKAPADPLLGQVVAGKFAVEERLGAGAMGVVYRARQLALDRTVAIKVLHRELAADVEFADRFAREARAASRLDHPNSIRIFDFGQDNNGLLYIAMEHVEGSDLFASVSQRGRLSSKEMVEILVQVLAALAVAHEMGVVHRDLKPENIMIVRGTSDDGQAMDVVKVCDFGIAKMLGAPAVAEGESRRKHSTTGLIIGTPAYMSPEQARGEAQDARSDLYAVGVVLYELLTGRVPFEAETLLAVALKHVSDEPVAPSARVPGVDAKLEAICLKALQKKPAERYQSAREMRLALLFAANQPGFGSTLPPVLAVPRPQFNSSKPTFTGVAPAGGRVRAKRSRAWLLLLLVPAGSLLLLRGRHSLSSDAHESGAQAQGLSPRASPSVALNASSDAPPEAATGAPSADTPNGATASSAVPVSAALQRAVLGAKRRGLSGDAAGSAALPQVGDASSGSGEPAPEPQNPPVRAPAPAVQPAPVAAGPVVSAAVAALASPQEPTYDLSAARVAIGTAKNAVGATALSVTRTVSAATARITACYKAALPQLGRVFEGAGTLHVDTDGAGVITDARLSGPIRGRVTTCVSAAVQGLRVANVDTGSASADVPLSFRAH